MAYLNIFSLINTICIINISGYREILADVFLCYNIIFKDYYNNDNIINKNKYNTK